MTSGARAARDFLARHPEVASNLKPCPCGKVPTGLHVTCDKNSKWGHVAGECCGEWMIEFRNGYDDPPDKEEARLAWNDAPRSSEEER